MKNCAFYFCAVIGIQMFATALVKVGLGLTGISNTTASDTIISSIIANAAIIIIFAATKWHAFSLDFLKKRPWATLYWTFLAALGMLIPSSFLEDLLPDSLTQDVLEDVMPAILSNVWGALTICILAPVAEEMVFRGAIQKSLIHYYADSKKNNRFLSNPTRRAWLPLIITSMLFAAIHGNPAQMPHAFLIGLLLSWLAYRSGSIIPGIMIHVINNSMAFVLYQIYPNSYNMKIIEFFGNSEVRLSLAIALSLALFIPAIYQLNKLLRK